MRNPYAHPLLGTGIAQLDFHDAIETVRTWLREHEAMPDVSEDEVRALHPLLTNPIAWQLIKNQLGVS